MIAWDSTLQLTDLVFPSLLDPPGFPFTWWLFLFPFYFTFPNDVDFFGGLVLRVLVLGSAGWLDFVPFYEFRFAWIHYLWLWMVGLPVLGMNTFTGALYLLLVSLSQYVPCGVCDARLVVLQQFWWCWKGYLLVFFKHCHQYIFIGFSLLFLSKEFLENHTHFYICFLSRVGE